MELRGSEARISKRQVGLYPSGRKTSWRLDSDPDAQEGEKRTNWLLIKHRDKFVREGKKNRILEEDTSVASGRSMDEITTGKGRGPKPFVTAKRSRAPANAEWKSHRASARAPAAKKRSRPAAARTSRFQKMDTNNRKTAADQRMPSFIAPLYFGRATAGRRRLGPRDQIRRIPHSDAG